MFSKSQSLLLERESRSCRNFCTWLIGCTIPCLRVLARQEWQNLNSLRSWLWWSVWMTSTWLQLSCWVWLCPWQCLVYSVQISRLLKFDDHSRYRRRFVCLGSSVLPPLPAVQLIIVSMLQHAWICGRFTNHCSFPSGAWQSSPNKSREPHNWVFAMLCLSSNILPKFYLRYKNIRSWTEGIDQVQRSVNCDRSLL